MDGCPSYDLKKDRLFLMAYTRMAKFTLASFLSRSTAKIISYRKLDQIRGCEKPLLILGECWTMMPNASELITEALMRPGCVILNEWMEDVTDAYQIRR